ncbi:MAG: hypothetical protein ACK4PR_07895 [Gammaproteobacteria bacterium]
MFLTKKIFNCFLTLCTALCSSAAFSATSSSTENEEFYLPFLKPGHIVFEVGGYQGIQGEKQHINIHGLIGDTFTVDDMHDENGLLGLGFFLDGPNLGRVQTSFGINAFYLAQMSISGDVIQEDYFDNLSYHYNIKSFPLYAMAKSIIHLNSSKYALTLDAGIGPNFIRTSSFGEHSLDGGITIPEDPFSSHTATALSETVGIGLRINDVFGPIPLEIGYRFFYLGQGRFSTNNDQVLNTLNTGKMYANAIVCSISF